MAELDASDAVAFTNGRLKDNDETQRMVDAALAATRRDVGWHVSPVKIGDTVTLDGPCSRILVLPTRKLVELVSITEDGIELDLSDVTVSGEPDTVVRLRKNDHSRWRGGYQSISVELDHGYTEAEAADWRHAVLTLVDQMSRMPTFGAQGRPDADLVMKKVDDVQLQWGQGVFALTGSTWVSVADILDRYRLTNGVFV